MTHLLTGEGTSEQSICEPLQAHHGAGNRCEKACKSQATGGLLVYLLLITNCFTDRLVKIPTTFDSCFVFTLSTGFACAERSDRVPTIL